MTVPAAAATAATSSSGRRSLILVLIVGTAGVLWRITRPGAAPMTRPMTAAPLDGRRRDLAALADGPLDVLVVGGGIVGSGALLDAATRGLRAALVERDDIAVGTSSRSSRLIHGGLRYLEQYRFGLVREALAERSRILHLAPHLVTIEPLLFPLFGWPVATRAFYQAGMTLYDVLGARTGRRLAPAPVGRRGPRPRARDAPRPAARRAAVPRRRRGRRPLHARGRSDGRRRRERPRDPGRGRVA